MMRRALSLILLLASCSTQPKDEAPQPRQDAGQDRAQDAERDDSPKPKQERAQGAPAKPPPLPPVCTKQPKDDREEVLNMLDCLIKTDK